MAATTKAATTKIATMVAVARTPSTIRGMVVTEVATVGTRVVVVAVATTRGATAGTRAAKSASSVATAKVATRTGTARGAPEVKEASLATDPRGRTLLAAEANPKAATLWFQSLAHPAKCNRLICSLTSTVSRWERM